MTLPVRLLLAAELLLCAIVALSPLIVAYALKPQLLFETAVEVLAERVAPPLIVSTGLIGIGLIGWARYGPKAVICVTLFFCPFLAALFLAIKGFGG